MKRKLFIDRRHLGPLFIAILASLLAGCGNSESNSTSNSTSEVATESVAEALTGLPEFELLEATIGEIQTALLAKKITTEELVRMYLARIKAYNGTCVNEPEGRLGPITTIANAGQVNALSTLNLRPTTRVTLGFDDRKARSMTDSIDNDSSMPDALEVAIAQDRSLSNNGELVGPLHGVVIAIKDQYDTFDLRTTSGGEAEWANDRPPDDAEFVKRLRDAGAIILAKANLAEYASGGARSAFGGTFCNPYDTERSPNASSAGSGTSVATNMVTCAIAEETSSSIRGPAVASSTVGIAPTQELVSRDGMIGSGINTRTGPICRNVEDTARVLEVIAGYDEKDPMTAYSVDRIPEEGYAQFAKPGSLEGVRIGILREYMDKSKFAQADEEIIDTIDREIGELAKLGATIIDPGPEGGIFQSCMNQYGPELNNLLFTKQFPALFAEVNDQIPTFVDLHMHPDKVPEPFSIRDFERVRGEGESKFSYSVYIKERGDANIQTHADLINKATFYNDPNFPDRKERRESTEAQTRFDMAERVLHRYAVREIVMQCMQKQNLDALVYPTSNLPVNKLTSPSHPAINGRSGNGVWTFLGQQGFPAITVPAGYTTQVYDRVENPDDPENPTLVGPIAAKLPIGIDFLGRPFSEPTLFKIAAAYEAATKHRQQPRGFGPVQDEAFMNTGLSMARVK